MQLNAIAQHTPLPAPTIIAQHAKIVSTKPRSESTISCVPTLIDGFMVTDKR
jgi:hypothetical protein